jgi:hypothetical protein
MDLSLAEVRRVALAAQGFGHEPRRPALAHVRKVAATVQAIQIDSISVLVRSHYLPAFSRLGPYPIDAMDALAYVRRELFECWGHAACLMPVALYPLLRHRMDRLRESSPWTPGRLKPDRRYLRKIYDEVAERGPLEAGELSDRGARGAGKWWEWSAGKAGLEHLLACGLLAVAGRRGFTRLYDITERVIPRRVLDAPAPSAGEAQKELICLAARALGVGTARQLGDYFGLNSYRVRVKRADGKRSRATFPRLVDELVEEGRLRQVSVEGWHVPGYMTPATRVPRAINERALLSPFDSLIRCSAESCFGFSQPLAQQLYVPAERRVYGYYVLPFLLGDRLVARCDLKAERRLGVLQVQGAFVEPGHGPKRVAAELAKEVERMRSWLELDDIQVADRGNLARQLRINLKPRKASRPASPS